jgi:tRNA-splicing ligase RtcB
MDDRLPIEQLGDVKFRIDRHGEMLADAVFYASSEIMAALENEEFASLRQLRNVACLPGIVGPALAMPDIHWGYGFPIGGVAAFDPAQGGVVSPGGVGYDINCGVRLLASNLAAADIERKKSRLADALFSNVPAGVGTQAGAGRLSDSDLRKLLSQGARWAIERGQGEPEDLLNIESGGQLPEADPDLVSERALERGAPQLGSLGSGNHFLEVQVVDEVYDEAAAQAMGLAAGYVAVLIHTGSRGLGHEVCTEHVRSFVSASPRFGIDLPDRQLAAAPSESPEGRAYLAAMAAAANFAFANRQRITASVRSAFEQVGFLPRDHSLRVVYDLGHNNAKFETHQGRRLLVHRKGATRAFGPGESDLPDHYRELGQPVFVPGDMGRYSFVLVGTTRAMTESFGSSCHGAGRLMSRKRAKKEARRRSLPDELAERGIELRAANRATVAEEMPEAYKDVAKVVDVVEKAGLGRKVARLRPLVVIKG